ncbi:hypothetical protein HWD16_gp25 [Microbacterium phage Arete]|uniref:Uncharacterized protein n=1 Tax=Microbacterium phage Arete TaxID=2713257 RepID=A0A6G8R1R9_9CAUD|nr:hypothetical protein HWD16_gp25 [Microbacterium phage Arete]QIN93908.1 hypothetical protein SEA_ARETE_25 [Microbacterium phage Arete]URM86419.1 hypothetical protein SEA_GSHELBY23_23 [Microbacterium phage Gshelby23]
MRYNKSTARRKASKDTPSEVQRRVLAHITAYLLKHGCAYEADGNSALVIHTPDSLSNLSFRAYYGNEQASYILVEIVIDGRRTVSGERSATQRLYNHAHTIVGHWAQSIGVTS